MNPDLMLFIIVCKDPNSHVKNQYPVYAEDEAQALQWHAEMYDEGQHSWTRTAHRVLYPL